MEKISINYAGKVWTKEDCAFISNLMSENDALKRIIGSLKLELEEAKRAIKIPSSKYYQTKDGVIIVEKDDTLIHIYCKDNTIFIEKCRPQS